MHRQRQPHIAGLAQRQQQQSGRADPEQQPDERIIHPEARQRPDSRFHAPLLAPQPGRANTQHHAANRSQNHRKLKIAIGRLSAEDVVIERAGACRGKTEHEAIEGQVMVMPPGKAGAVIRAGAAATLAIIVATKIAQRGRGAKRVRKRRHATPPRTGNPPVAPPANNEGEDDKGRNGQGNASHDRMRHQDIERPLAKMHAPEQMRRDHRQHQADGQRKPGRRHHRHDKTIAVEQAGKRPRPGEFPPACGAALGKGERNIDGEFMRRRILTGMVAGTAMMTEIGQKGGIPDIEQAAAFHRRKDRTEPLAIATGITDLHDPRGLFMRFCAGKAGEIQIIHG